MDVGQSVNPAIDIGQIEGAFVQGYGWCTMEELIWGDGEHKWVKEGQLFTRGPGTYKIPSFNDVPADFRVTLMNRSNKRAVHSSKGIGEPPYFLACSAFFAIRNAIKSAREESGGSPNEYFSLNLPATSERIRMSCGDAIAASTIGGEKDPKHYQAKGSW
jgi:xanthine dehydrogenase/oxidase